MPRQNTHHQGRGKIEYTTGRVCAYTAGFRYRIGNHGGLAAKNPAYQLLPENRYSRRRTATGEESRGVAHHAFESAFTQGGSQTR
jgi:hypothetical protein